MDNEVKRGSGTSSCENVYSGDLGTGETIPDIDLDETGIDELPQQLENVCDEKKMKNKSTPEL